MGDVSVQNGPLDSHFTDDTVCQGSDRELEDQDPKQHHASLYPFGGSVTRVCGDRQKTEDDQSEE